MSDYLIWLIAALALIIIEMMTGTFYLLVLGIAAFAGAAAAYVGAGALAQVGSTGVIAAIGLFMVNRWHRGRAPGAEQAHSLDVGQAVTLESWLDHNTKRVRVKYRGASWDAQLVGDPDVQLNDTLYICGARGSQLQVSRSPSAL